MKKKKERSKIMNIFELEHPFHQTTNQTTPYKNIIRRLFLNPIKITDSEVKKPEDNKIKCEKAVFQSLRDVKVMLNNMDIINCEELSQNSNNQNQQNCNSTPKKEQQPLSPQKIAEDFRFQKFLEDMLSNKNQRFCILNSMIYNVFNYFFAWQGYLHSLPLDQQKYPAVLIRIIYDAQSYQFSKWCLQDKQLIIKRIFKTNWPKYRCERLINNCLKTSEYTEKNTRKEIYYELIKEQHLEKFSSNQDISYLLRYLREKEEMYSDIYK